MENENLKTKLTVKYHNDLNDIQFGVFSARELDMFMIVLNAIRVSLDNGEIKPNSRYISREYSFAQIREWLNLSTRNCSDARLVERIKAIGYKVTRIQTFVSTPSKGSGYLTLCPRFWIGGRADTVQVDFNMDYLYLLADISTHYTSFELREYLSLNHIGTKILYHKIKQYKMSGHVSFSDIDTFRKQMALPDTARARQIIARIVEPAVEELKPIFPELELNVFKSGSNHEITGFELIFKPTKTRSKRSDKDSAQEKKPRRLVDFRTMKEIVV